MKPSDALKRLERAGSDTSRVTKKLQMAAELIADKLAWDTPGIENLEELPRGYRYEVVTMNGPLGPRTKAFIVKDGFILSHCSERSCSRYAIAEDVQTLSDLGLEFERDDYGNLFFSDTPLEVYHQFARDTASGLLDEIRAKLENKFV